MSHYLTFIVVVERESLPTGRKLPTYYPVPVLLNARLAVGIAMDQKEQGLGIITLVKALEHLLTSVR